MTVSIIVPVYNGGEAFHHCMASLARLVPSPAEVIVVVDGATDDSRNVAQTFEARVLDNPSPRGPAYARNQGARAAHGDILFFVDADVAVPPDAIAQIQHAFAHDPELAALIGSYDDAPSAPNFISQYKNLLHHYVHQQGREEASTFWGACGAVRRTVFTAMGGFDEGYRTPSIEDIELGYRLVRAGHRIRLHKKLQVKHLKRWSVTSLLWTDFFARALPWTELLLREGRIVNDLNLQRTARLSVVCAYGLLGTLVLAMRWARALGLSVGLGGLLLTLNASVYRFFWRKRGCWFALQTIPWHWLYYIYSGFAFGIGCIRFWVAKVRLP